MMPYTDEQPLPCVADPEPFDAVIDLHEHRGRYGVRQRAIVQRARDVCGGCAHQGDCLRAFGDIDGVVAGLTRAERSTLKLVKAS